MAIVASKWQTEAARGSVTVVSIARAARELMELDRRRRKLISSTAKLVNMIKKYRVVSYIEWYK